MSMELAQKGKEYHTDKHLVYSCQYHVIFCPKYRRKILTGAIAERLRELIIEKQEELRYKVIELEINA